MKESEFQEYVSVSVSDETVETTAEDWEWEGKWEKPKPFPKVPTLAQIGEIQAFTNVEKAGKYPTLAQGEKHE